MRNLIIVLILVVTAAIGCSSGTQRPTEPSRPSLELAGNLPVGVSDRFPDGSPAEGFGVMGLFTLDIDSKNLKAEMIPARKSALTDALEVVDITNFLTMAPCSNCVKIKSVSLDADSNIVVSIGIKHPFPVGDPFKPITGRNRADLHVFNIEGIVVSQGGTVTDFPTLGMSVNSNKLVNASGYTTYLDAVLDSEFFPSDADVHPYILHFADYTAGNFDSSNPMGFVSVTDPPPSGNLVMAMGCDYDFRDYIFDLSSGDMTYTFAVGCTYAVSSANKSQRFTPEYRIPQHLKKAASEVRALPLSGTLKVEQPTETVTLQVAVVDPSQGVAVGDALDQMLADSSVGSVVVEIPNILNLPMTQPGSAAISGTGHSPSDPLLFEFTFSNEKIAAIGTYTGLVKVLDTYPPGLNSSPLLNAKDGIKRVDPLINPLTGTFDITEFATYAAFDVVVELGLLGSDPVADLQRSKTGCPPANVTFDASGSTDADDDPLAIPLHFEFDFDYDGITFTIDWPMSTNPIATHIYNIEGCYTAAVRVTDSDNNQDIATVRVPIGHFTPGPAESTITDGITITDIDFNHNVPVFVGDVNWPGTAYPTKGSARGDGYVYTAFYGLQGTQRSIFFARSNDDGLSWSTPVVVHVYDAQGLYSGCSIAADKTGQVLIVWTDHFHRDVGLEYSTDHGDTFTSKLIRDESNGASWCNKYRNPDVAIDPTNPNNIIITSWYAYFGTSWFADVVYMYIDYSSTGPAGTFTEALYVTDFEPGNTENIYGIQAHYAIDGDAYVIAGENNRTFVYRSSDSGATWPDDPEHHSISAFDGWHRDFDSAMDLSDPNVFYVVRVLRSPWNPTYPIKLFKATDGITLNQILANVNDNTTSGVYRFNPSITVNDAGVVYVMWQTNSSGSYNIIADFSCNGISFGTDIVFNTIDNGNEVDADLIPDECGDGVVCIWEQNGNNPGGKLVARQG